jgi:hypothetical protein
MRTMAASMASESAAEAKLFTASPFTKT